MPRYDFTRDELANALTRLDVRVLTSGTAAGMINADSMADAIIKALTADPAPVHYHWPVTCGDPTPGIKWTGNLDRVTCPACRADEASRQTDSVVGARILSPACVDPGPCVNGPDPHQWHVSCQCDR